MPAAPGHRRPPDDPREADRARLIEHLAVLILRRQSRPPAETDHAADRGERDPRPRS